MTNAVRISVAALAALLLASPARPAEVGVAAEAVFVRDLQVGPGGIRGSLRSTTDAELRDVRLLVTHSFLWSREQSPGELSPGRSEVYLIPGPIPPFGIIEFDEPLVPPLPARSDGRFESSASILGYTAIGP